MHNEVLKDIRDTEDRLQSEKTDAQAAAKNMLAEAEKKGLAAVNEAVRRAEEEVKRLVDEADRQAEEQAVKLSSDTLKEQDEIRRRAESRLDEAAGLIVERIVNG